MPAGPIGRLLLAFSGGATCWLGMRGGGRHTAALSRLPPCRSGLTSAVVDAPCPSELPPGAPIVRAAHNGVSDYALKQISSSCSALEWKQGDTMQDQDAESRRDHLVGFVMSHNGELHISRAWLSPGEARSLLRLLSGLAEVGLIILPKVQVSPWEEGAAAVRADVAAYATEPLVAAVEAVQAGRASKPDQPAAVMPVWPFAPDPEQPEVLLGSGQLWGVDVYLEALPVEDDDLPVPMASVAERFETWRRAAGGERPLATIRLPGRGDAYVLFAST